MYKIIIVEDEELIRKGIRFGFDYSTLGFVVIDEAEDGQEAIDKIHENQPDIVIIDINLPLKDGLQVLEETQDVPYSAIILSGYSDFKYAQEAIRLKVVDYLTKPLDPSKFEEALKQAIINQQMIKSLKQIDNQHQELLNISLLENVRSTTNEIVIEMIKYIQKNYQEKFTMQDVVKYLGYSETHLTNSFKKHTLTTFNDYLNRYRIMKVIALMKDSIVDPNKLSELTGFSNAQYLDKVFYKYVGVSLKQYEQYLETGEFY